jgi:hypothetical protein
VTPGQANQRPDKGDISGGDVGTAGQANLPLPIGFPIALAAFLAAVVAIWVAVSRYLRPRTVSGVWQRTALLTRLAGIGRRSSETPLEFGARLAGELPDAARPARELAQRFTVAAYAPGDLAAESRPAVLAVWEELRPALLRRVRLRFRLA